MVIKLNYKNIKFSSIFILFLISYAFYSIYLLGQLNLKLNGINILYTYIILSFCCPFIFLFLNKKLNNFRNNVTIKNKTSFTIVKVAVCLYLLISSIFVSFYTIYFESMYFYNKYNVFIIAIILLLPLIIFSKNIIKSTFHLHPINIIIYAIFFYLFFTNQHELNYYSLIINDIKLNDLFETIILLMPLILEPFLLFYLVNLSKEEITKKKMIGGIILISLTSSLSFLFLGNQFGVLLNYLDFPFLQAWRNIYINEYIENLDCLNIILFIVNCITRLLMSCSIIINITKINKQYIPIIFGLLSLGIGCFFTLNQSVFEQLKMQILTINSVLLLIITAITLYFIIVGGKHEKQDLK